MYGKLEAALAGANHAGQTGVEISAPSGDWPRIYTAGVRSTLAGEFYEPGTNRRISGEVVLEPSMAVVTAPVAGSNTGVIAVAMFRQDDLLRPGAPPIAAGIYDPAASSQGQGTLTQSLV